MGPRVLPKLRVKTPPSAFHSLHPPIPPGLGKLFHRKVNILSLSCIYAGACDGSYLMMERKTSCSPGHTYKAVHTDGIQGERKRPDILLNFIEHRRKTKQHFVTPNIRLFKSSSLYGKCIFIFLLDCERIKEFVSAQRGEIVSAEKLIWDKEFRVWYAQIWRR